MFCKNCGRDNADGVKFCAGCGMSLAEDTPPMPEQVQRVNVISNFEPQAAAYASVPTAAPTFEPAIDPAMAAAAPTIPPAKTLSAGGVAVRVIALMLAIVCMLAPFLKMFTFSKDGFFAPDGVGISYYDTFAIIKGMALLEDFLDDEDIDLEEDVKLSVTDEMELKETFGLDMDLESVEDLELGDSEMTALVVYVVAMAVLTLTIFVMLLLAVSRVYSPVRVTSGWVFMTLVGVFTLLLAGVNMLGYSMIAEELPFEKTYEVAATSDALIVCGCAAVEMILAACCAIAAKMKGTRQAI